MKKTAFRYAVLRFMPYPETGEFANIGVIAAAPRENKFTFYIEKKRTRRLTNFFSNLDARMYKAAIADYEAELVAIADLVDRNKLKAIDAFERLVQPRSTVFQFNNAGAMLADSFELGVERLFDDQVNHVFAASSTYIRELNGRIRSCLNELSLIQPFKRGVLEKAGYKVGFDFLQQDQQTNEALKVIKPFYVDSQDPGAIYDFGDNWRMKLIRLKEFQLLPNDILFPVVEPSGSDLIFDAWEVVKGDLQNYGEVISANNVEEIKKFAES